MIEQLGAYPLFLGVETSAWSLADFIQAAHNAKALGCTSLLVKIADGGNIWYANGVGWQKVLDTINAQGIRAIPYTYCYGDKFGAIQTEIAILQAAMRYAGIVIADMEEEFNGQDGWAATVTNALQPVPGIFGVTTWADPNLQDWNGVLTALKPCVNFWLPQVYSDYLASVYHTQYDPSGIPYYPILNLGTDAGPNDPVAIARTANSPIVGFWEYTPAMGAYNAIVKQIIKEHGVIMPIPNGWHYDANSNTLTPPNSKFVVTGNFAKKILSLPSWDANNVPIENAVQVPQCEVHVHPPQSGIRQLFSEAEMLDIPSRNYIGLGAIGYEVAACYNLIASLETQIAALKAQLSAVPLVAEVVTPLQALLANATLLEQEVSSALETQKVTAQHIIDKVQGK